MSHHHKALSQTNNLALWYQGAAIMEK